MKAIFCYDGPLYKDYEGNYYDSILNDQMFERYFAVADTLEIIIRTRYIESKDGMIQMDRLTNQNISVVDCPNIASIKEFIKRKRDVENIISEHVNSADIVFIRLPSIIGNISVDICRKMNKKYLIEAVGCPWDSYRNYSIRGKLIAPIAWLSMRRRIRTSPYVLYVTNKFLQNRYPTKGNHINCSNVELPYISEDIIHNRLEHIRTKNPNDIFYIGTAAGLDVRYKGQHYVIQALKLLKDMGITNLEYQLIGGGTGDYIRKVAKECCVEQQVKILGQVPHHQVFQWLKNLDLYIQPSRQEGLPRSVIEAMSVGLPCLGASTAGIVELLENDFLFSNSSKESMEIAEKISKLYKDKRIQEEQAKRNWKEAKKYKREVLAERRKTFFIRCLRGE